MVWVARHCSAHISTSETPAKVVSNFLQFLRKKKWGLGREILLKTRTLADKVIEACSLQWAAQRNYSSIHLVSRTWTSCCWKMLALVLNRGWKYKWQSICVSGFYHWSVFTIITLYLIPYKKWHKKYSGGKMCYKTCPSPKDDTSIHSCLYSLAPSHSQPLYSVFDSYSYLL